MAEISNSEYARLMVQHFGTQRTPSIRSVTKAQRVLLKTIFDGKGTIQDVCGVLGLPMPAAAVRYAQSTAPAPAGDGDGGSASAASVSALEQPQAASAALEQPQVAASALSHQDGASEPPIEAAAHDEDAVPAGAPSLSSASVAASATGLAVSNEQQNLVAPSQAPEAAGAGGSSSPSLPSQPLASVSAAPGDSLQRAAEAPGSSIIGASAAKKRPVRPVRDVEVRFYGPVLKVGARQNHQIDFGQGLPNPIFDQEKDCFKNSIALLMRLQHVPTSLNLQSPNMSLCDINFVLNQGGYYLRQLPLYFDENHNKFFKPEVPTLLAVFLQIQFGVDLPWLRDSSLDFSQVQKSISRVLLKNKKHNYLPFLILNPFNNNGVPLHCVGLECRWNKAIVWDPANVNSFEFSLRTLNALCDGRWTPSFRRIWCICARA